MSKETLPYNGGLTSNILKGLQGTVSNAVRAIVEFTPDPDAPLPKTYPGIVSVVGAIVFPSQTEGSTHKSTGTKNVHS